MTKDEALKLALEALENIEDYGNKEQLDQNHVAITALRQALEQPDAIEAAVRAENEACANVAETECCKCADAAAAIKARGE